MARKRAAPSDLSVSSLWCVVMPGPGVPFSRSWEIRFLRVVISWGRGSGVWFVVGGLVLVFFGLFSCFRRSMDVWRSQRESVVLVVLFAFWVLKRLWAALAVRLRRSSVSKGFESGGLSFQSLRKICLNAKVRGIQGGSL